MKIGKPTHYKLNAYDTACGVVCPDYATYDPSDVDCYNCYRTKKYRVAIQGEPLAIKVLKTQLTRSE